MTIEDDKAAILEVLKAETEAYLRKDLESLSSYWVQSEESRRMASVANLGAQVFVGWEAIRANYRHLMEQFPEKQPISRMHWERMNIVVCGDAAWASYDEVGDMKDSVFEMSGMLHGLKIFRRMEDGWKLTCLSVMQRSVDHVSAPLIEIGSDRAVLWMNAQAHEQLNGHPFLLVSAGHLRTQNRKHEANLQAAIDWASKKAHTHWTQEPLERLARAVILGENDETAPLYCWVLVEDGKILVSFNDNQLLKRRIAIAQGIYSLTAAQTQLAQLLAEGLDLSLAAEKLGVSINTLRTHLQRLFDKTGARSQSALVSLLLSADTPTAG